MRDFVDGCGGHGEGVIVEAALVFFVFRYGIWCGEERFGLRPIEAVAFVGRL